MKYQILQLKRSAANYRFGSLKYARACGISPDDYMVAFQGETRDMDTRESNLEALYYEFNVVRPGVLKCHSMCVSDIVKVNDCELWYCDSFGFTRMEEEEKTWL